MNDGLIPRRYAKALYRYAQEKGVAAEIYAMTNGIGEAFASEPALGTVMANPFVGAEKKEELLLTAAGTDARRSPVLADFLRLLAQNRRLELARGIALAYGDIYRRDNHIYRVNVTAAAPLDPEVEKRLKGLIESHLEGGKMEYTFATDPGLIGGFRVDIDNERLDASVANELAQMRLRLLGK